MARLRTSWFIIAILLLLCGTIHASLQSYSTGERHWIAVRTALPDGTAHTDLFTRPIAVGAEWRRLARVGPRVIDLAHRGSDAVAVTDAGNWVIAWPGDVVSPPRLPDAAAMLEIATSPEGGFWALGEIRSSGASTQPINPDSDTSLDEPALPAGTRVLYRFGTQSWERVAIVDDALLPREGRWSLGMLDARPMIAAVDRQQVRLVLLDSDHRQFSPLPSIDNALPVSIRLLEDPRPSVHVQASDRDTIYLLVADDWQPVTLQPDDAMRGAIDRSVAFVGANIRMIGRSGERILEQTFDRQGNPLGPSSAIDLPVPPAAPGAVQWWMNMIVLGVLVIVLLSTFRNRPIPDLERLRDTSRRAAPLGLRLLAGVVDAIPMLVGVAWLGSLTDSFENPTDSIPLSQLVWVGVLIMLYPIHTAVAEALTGKSLGKALCGLRVVDIAGTEPTTIAILLRNLVRILDLMLLFPLVFILISPLRQRIGDMAAGTVVVTDAEPPADADDEDDPSA